MFSYSPLNAHFFTKSFNTITTSEQRKTDLKFTDLSEYFFVSHPTSGQKEGSEHKRIMFFHPTEETISKQIEVTGMCEAIVNFTNGINSMDCGKDDATSCDFDFRYVLKNRKGVKFGASAVYICDCELSRMKFIKITSTNCKEIVLVVEKGNFLIGTSFNKKLCMARDYFPHLPTICSLLTNAYNAYKLLYGLLSNRFHTNSSEFKGTLDRFFTPFLHLYRVNKIPLIDLFNGVDFLSVDNLNFLEIDCLIANCIQEFPCIKKGMFFYQERLVQYSVSKKDLAALCQFVVQTLIPSAVQNEVCPPPSAANRRTSIKSARNGFMVDGAMLVDYLGEFTEHFFPKVFLRDSDATHSPLSAYELVAYRVRSATACFFVHESCMTKEKFVEFIENLADFIDEKIAAITSQMGADVSLPIHSDIPYHFIYYNPDSLSLRKSFSTFVIPGQNSPPVAQLPPPNIHRLTYETYDRFASNADVFAQIFLKADNDWWIVFKRIERRILVLFILQSAATSIVDIEFYVENIVNSAPFKILFIPQ